jgi:hypothetical protein
VGQPVAAFVTCFLYVLYALALVTHVGVSCGRCGEGERF